MASDTLTPAGLSEPKEPPQDESWTARFRRLGLQGLTPVALEVVEADSAFIVDKCIVPPCAEDRWSSATRVRTGMVVGAVQSGKTASMLAVAARLLDRGTDILVVLAGTRIALWQQTLERLLRQLDGTTAKTRRERRSSRFFMPDPDAVLGAERPSPPEYVKQAKRSLLRSLGSSKPIIIVIPKQDDHLIAVAGGLQGAIEQAIEASIDAPLHMVVLDDEADDGSVLDAGRDKVIPQRIQSLWSKRPTRDGATSNQQLYATYVAYTATPQANFLQFDSNPLSPRDFCAALRAPWSSGGGVSDSRQPTFTEPEGIRSFYFGGEAWYVPPPALTVSVHFPDAADYADDWAHGQAVETESHRMVDDGIRAFLVAAALSDLESESLGKQSIRSLPKELTTQELQGLPAPVGMLIHPASSKDRHWSEACRIRDSANGAPANSSGGDLDLTIHGKGWLEDLTLNPEAWSVWHGSYRVTQTDLATTPGGAELHSLTEPDWPVVQERIRELVPLVQLRVINSDEKADDRPQYQPRLVAGSDDTWLLPSDLLTIFVSGNVMSRGITLEGLTTSVFTRSSSTPAADTQMQMQRWFGYRGSRAPLLRMFTFEDQLELFRAYHGYDTAMRREICSAMDNGSFATPDVILQGSVALATAKVPTRRLPLCPGATPSVRVLEVLNEELQAKNLGRVRSELKKRKWLPLSANGLQRGLICDVPWSMVEAAEFLESLRYEHHDPKREDDESYSRWSALEKQLDLASDDAPLLRTPGTSAPPSKTSVRSCPYTIAAYLRLWAAALERDRIDGMSTTLLDSRSWSLDRAKLPKNVQVEVGIRFGERDVLDTQVLGIEGVRPVERQASVNDGSVQLNTLWGSRGKGGQYYGDQRFDYHRPGAPLPPDLHTDGAFWRPEDHPILMLIHIVQARVDEQDYGGLGVAVGLSFPRGGPEQFAALRRIG